MTVTDPPTTPRTPYTAALQALEQGLCVIPPAEDGTKRPDTPSWLQYQQRRSTLDELERWYRNNQRHGIGIVCGAVSGNLETLEFEGAAIHRYDLWNKFIDAAERTGLNDTINRIITGYTEHSPTGGIHLLYRCEEAVTGNQKLARDPDRNVLIETRGEGGYIITAPSDGPIHPNQRSWTLTEGDFTTIATITAEERADLLVLAASLDLAPPDLSRDQIIIDQNNDRPGDRYNELPDIQQRTLELLEHHGWTRVYTRDGTAHLRRPGKTKGTSATLGYRGPGVLRIFSSNAHPFEEKCYSPFSVFTMLEHGGNPSAAARAVLAHTPVGTTTFTEIAAAEEKRDEPHPWLPDIYTANAVLSIPPPDPLIDGLLDRDSLSAIYGPPGAGKSFLALDWALHIATSSWWNQHHTQGGPVLYIAAEGVAGLGDRVRAWLTCHQRLNLDNIPITWLTRAINLSDPTQVAQVATLTRDLGAIYVIIDTLARCAAGLEENSAKDTSIVIRAMDWIRTCGTRPNVSAVHHSGKDIAAGLRGSSALLGAMDTVLLARPTERGLLLEHEKQKNHELGSRTHLWLRPHANSAAIVTRQPHDTDDTLTNDHYDLIDALKRNQEPASRAELVALLDIDPAIAYRRLIDLAEQGYVERHGKGPASRWTLTQQGHHA